jgi:hypothetical protein
LVSSFDPTGKFKKIDQVLPKKKGEKGNDLAKDIAQCFFENLKSERRTLMIYYLGFDFSEIE